MYLPDHAAAAPDKPAMISADTGQALTFGALNERSNRLAQLFHARGLRRGDHIAVLMENNLHFTESVWAAYRSGLYVTTVNRYLPPDEAADIVNDCAAKAIVTSFAKQETAAGLTDRIPNGPIRLMLGGIIPGWGPMRRRWRAPRRSRWPRSGSASPCSTVRARQAGRRASSDPCRS